MPSTPRPILLVEDNDDDVFFMRRALQSAGVTHPLSVLTNGSDAIDYLAGTGEFTDPQTRPRPLLILLDLKLPVKDGHEVLQWIRSQPALETLVVIMLTTSKERSDVDKAYRLGANAYLVKPSGAPQLIEQVKALKAYWLDQNEFA